ncbi:MAG: murein hydrolase activator EnvC family protein [Clostridium sp.]
MKVKFKVLSLIMAMCLFLNVQVANATGSSSIQDQINGNNDKINQLEKEKEELNNKKTEAQKELDELMKKVNSKEKELNSSAEKVNEFQRKIDELQKSIDDVQAKISKMDDEIKLKEKVIEEKKKEADEREKLLGGRLRSYYKMDMTSQFIYILVSSNSFSDLISNVFNINKLINMDNQLLNDIEKTKAELESAQKSLAEQIVVLEDEKNSIVQKQDELKNAQNEFVKEKNIFQAQMDELSNLERQKERVINNLSEEEKEIKDKIGNLNDFNKDLQDELDKIFDNIGSGNNGGESSQGESFLRPTSGTFTSPYGPRKHPITGVNGFHTGIDLANSTGTPILASKSGTVVEARTMNGYGKTIIIDHGGGYQTLYAHNNELLVSVGQKVKRGQTIAKMGSTGNSTGPHLHFEIRINGKHTDPMKYIN